MPSLEEILKKTKAKSEQVKITHRPPSIATDDRPYSNPDTQHVTVSSNITEIVSHHPKETHILMSENKANNNFQKVPAELSTLNVIEASPDERSTLLKRATNSTIKIDNKPTTKWQQTSNKLATNRQQTSNKPTTNRQQNVNKSHSENKKWQQSGNTTGNKTGNKVATNRQQSGNKVATNVPFSKLVGLQREIIIFMCHECKNSRSKITEPLTLEYMANSLKHSAGAIKTTIQRLEQKGCLVRVEFKNGRGGWSRYELSDNTYHDVIRSETDNKLATNRQQSGNKVATQPTTEPTTSASSSSSKYIKETTTTSLTEEWNFNIAPYARFGFTLTQLKQLASLGIVSATQVEQSLIEFSFDLDNHLLPPIKTNKINFLMGLLRAGSLYVSEGFKNEQETTIEEMARRSRIKRENAMKAKFEAWEGGLTEETMKEFEKKMPTHLVVRYRAHGINDSEVRQWLFNYYLQLI